MPLRQPLQTVCLCDQFGGNIQQISGASLFAVTRWPRAGPRRTVAATCVFRCRNGDKSDNVIRCLIRFRSPEFHNRITDYARLAIRLRQFLLFDDFVDRVVANSADVTAVGGVNVVPLIGTWHVRGPSDSNDRPRLCSPSQHVHWLRLWALSR